MQTKVKQRLVGTGVLCLFLLPTVIILICHNLSTSVGSKPSAASLAIPNTGQNSTVTASATPLSTPSTTSVSIPTNVKVANLKLAPTSVPTPKSTSNQVEPVAAAASASVSATPAPVHPSDKPLITVATPNTPITTTMKAVGNNVSSAPVPTPQPQTTVATSSGASTKLTSPPPQQQVIEVAANNASDTNSIPSSKIEAQPIAPKSSIASTEALNAISPSAPTTAAWVVKVASFTNQQNAQRLLNKLRNAGFHAYVRQKMNANGRTLAMVFVGPEVLMSKIKLLQANLKNQFNINGILRKYKV